MTIEKNKNQLKDTKDKILKVALKLFSEKGYYAASVRKITSSLGLRESAMYNHYSSKQKILDALCEKFKPGRIHNTILTDDLLDTLNQPDKFLELFAKRLLKHWMDDEEKMFFKFLLKEGTIKYKNEKINLTSYLNELRALWFMIFDEMKKLEIINDFDPHIITDEYLFYLVGLRIELLNDEFSDSNLYKKVNKHVDFIWSTIKRK